MVRVGVKYKCFKVSSLGTIINDDGMGALEMSIFYSRQILTGLILTCFQPVFQIMPILPPETDENVCGGGRTDVGSSLPYSMGWDINEIKFHSSVRMGNNQ